MPSSHQQVYLVNGILVDYFNNPLYLPALDGPTGPMGLAHANTLDAITMGYLDRMLFVDYNRFCNSPKSQLKRIYDFFELPFDQHNLQKIEQTEVYNDQATQLPNLHKIKPTISKTTVNCVEHLGLDLYQQYNREIFWDAWI